MNLIATLAEQGLHISRAGQKLVVIPASRLTHELRILILANKPQLLAMLPDTSELERLISAVASYHGFTSEQTVEAQEIAASDVENALICFRSLAQKAGLAINE